MAEAPSAIPAAADSAIARARAWLDTLDIDCARLDRRGLKGKKRLAEILEAYLDCRERASGGAERRAILDRVTRLAAQTRDDAYHDLADCPEAEFHETSLSYLRVAWLLDRFGLDTREYRRRILAVMPRMVAHLSTRGAWQREMFSRYFHALGLRPAAPGAAAIPPAGVVARRLPLQRFDVDRAYDLAHEVFAVFEADSARALARFTVPERTYLGATLPELAARARELGQVDLAAELLSCMALTGGADDARLSAGIRWLLDQQAADGSWEREAQGRLRRPGWIPERDQLHTTLVAIEALCETDRGRSRTAEPIGPRAECRGPEHEAEPR